MSEAAMVLRHNWTNSFTDVMLSNNDQHGLVLAEANANNNQFTHCSFANNDGAGVVLRGIQNSFTGCLWERCLATGVFASATDGVSLVGCYFEDCGSTGHTFTQLNGVALPENWDQMPP